MTNPWNERRRKNKQKPKTLRVPKVPLEEFPADPLVPEGWVYSEASPEDMAKPVISREEFARILKQRGYTDAMIQNELDQLMPGWDLIDMGEDETPEEVADTDSDDYSPWHGQPDEEPNPYLVGSVT